MQYPYDRFIRFLFSRRANVSGTLESIGLPRLSSEETTAKSLSTIDLPEEISRYVRNGGDPKEVPGFMDQMREIGIQEMWEVQKEFLKDGVGRDMRVAWSIFSDPKLRTAYAVLRLSRFSIDEIKGLFKNQYDITLSPSVEKILKSWFFDFSNMDREDWKCLIRNLDEEQKSKYRLVLERKPKHAIEFALGQVPNLGYRDVLNDIMATSYSRFKEASEHPLLDSLTMKWAELAMRAGEKQVRYTKDPTKDLRQDVQMRFEFEEMSFPTLAELPDIIDSSPNS